MQLPLHPLVVHFPIALITAALIFHSIHLRKPEWINKHIGLWLLGLSTIFSIVSVLSGQKEMQKAGELGYSIETLNLINQHQSLIRKYKLKNQHQQQLYFLWHPLILNSLN